MKHRSRLPLAAALLVALLAAGVIGWAIRGPGQTTTQPPPVGLYPQPTRLDHGVPVGWPHTQGGAIAAAAAYAKAFVQPSFIVDRARRRDVLTAMSTPGFAASYEKRYGPALERYTRDVPFGRDLARGVESVVFQSALSYRLQHYDAGRASIRLWTVGVVGNAASRPPVATWNTEDLGLTWTHGDWKLSSASPQRPGPTPRLEGSPTAVRALLTQIKPTRALQNVP